MRPSAIAPSELLTALRAEAPADRRLRSSEPRETVEAALSLARSAGITRVANITRLDRLGLPVLSIYRPNSLSFAVSSGKGATLAGAYVSALLEALELHHAEVYDFRVPVHALDSGVDLVDLEALPRARDAPPLQALDLRHLSVSIGTDLASGRPFAVPHDLVHAAFRPGGANAGSGFLLSTNGLAAGNTVQEAALHGICEAVERDALALLRSRRGDEDLRGCPILDWDSVADPDCCRLREACDRVGLVPIVADMTTEIGIPAFYCRLVAPGRDAPPTAADGCGCHPVAATALRRAVTEAAQTRLLVIAGARDDLRQSDFVRRTWVLPPEWPRRFALQDRSAPTVATTAELLMLCIAKLSAAGFGNVIGIDLRSKTSRLSVLRIVVPGLEGSPHSRRYAPGARARLHAARA